METRHTSPVPTLQINYAGLMEVSSHHAGVGVGACGEDLNVLEAEITELQRENARVESQMLRLRTDITAMEAHLRHDKEPQLLPPRGSNLTDYYESLRHNVMTLLEHVRVPSGCLPSGCAAAGQPLPYSDVRVGPEHFDSYLSKLQTLCEEGGAGGAGGGPNRALYGAVRSGLPTPI